MCLRYPKGVAPPRIHRLDTAPCHIYHFGRCHESKEGSRIEFDAVCLGPKFTMEWQYKLWLSNSSDAPGMLHNFEVDLSGDHPTLKRRVADSCSCEFPAIHPYRHVTGGSTGVPAVRYTYLMAADKGCATPYQAVVKHDAQEEAGRAVWHTDGAVGEPCFIPRLGRASATRGAEDDGWVLVQVYDPKRHGTDFVLLDAQHMGDGPLCVIHLPHIPYAFHGTFVPTTFVHPPACASNPRKKGLKAKL